MRIFDPIKTAALCGEYKDFKPFLGTDIEFPSVDTPLGKARIAAGEKYMDYQPSILPLSDYRRFIEDGTVLLTKRLVSSAAKHLQILFLQSFVRKTADLCVK